MLSRRYLKGVRAILTPLAHSFSVDTAIPPIQPGFFDIRSKQLEGRSIYLDFGATTPIDFRAMEAMLPYMTEMYGNPHSRSHHYGWESEKAIETARGHVAALLNADPKEVIFTSGATESNNLALKGLADFYGKASNKRHIVTTQFVLPLDLGTQMCAECLKEFGRGRLSSNLFALAEEWLNQYRGSKEQSKT